MTNNINAFLNLPSVAMMVVILASELLRKKKYEHYTIIISIVFVNIASLICNFFYWTWLGNESLLLYIKIIWGIMYFLSVSSVMLLHLYLLTIASNNTKVPRLLYSVTIPLTVILALIYGSSFISGVIFSFSPTGEIIKGELYELGPFIRASILILDIIITLVFSRKLGVGTTFRFLCYEIIPIGAMFVDYRFGSSIVFIVVSLLILLDYVCFNVNMNIQFDVQSEQLAKQEVILTQQKTKIMISQIQPHFLYNVISSIMSFCKEDPDKAVSALADFSGYLRTNMRSLSLDTPVSFEKELEHVKTYIRLEKLRFRDRLNIEYDFKITDFYVPSLSIQPLVENAVKHGIEKKAKGGTIKISTSYNKDGIFVIVQDDGVGFNPNELTDDFVKSDHVGLSNVKERIASMCNGIVDVTSKKRVGTTIKIFLPNDGQV